MADRYFVDGLVDSNWSSITNWSLTDGGVGGQAVPTASDAVFFTANSPNCTVNTSARVALSLNFTGYTNTITMSQQITVSGSVTLVSAMTIAGTGALIVNAAATLTSNTKVWPNPLSLTSAVTYTLADNWNVDGLLTLGAGAATVTTINGFTITASAGLTISLTSGQVTGTTNFILDGTGTVTGSNSSNGDLTNNLTINTAGTITFAAVIFCYTTGTLTYTAGTVVVTAGATLQGIGSTTLNTSSIVWDKIILQGAGSTYALTSQLRCSGLVTIGSGAEGVTVNGSTIISAGGLRYGGTGGLCKGTTIIELTGTGNVDAPSVTNGRLENPITFNAPSGTITVSSLFLGDIGNILYSAGTIVTTAGTWASSGGSGLARIIGG